MKAFGKELIGELIETAKFIPLALVLLLCYSAPVALMVLTITWMVC